MKKVPKPPKDKGYADMHSHILYDIDDGVTTIEESVEIVKLLAHAGFSTSYATPHNMPGNDRNTLLSGIKERINRIYLALESEGITYKINTGAENYFDTSLNIKNPESYFIPLGDSNVFLVEIPFIGEISYHLGALRKTGFQCIIAHVERYLDVVQNPDKLFMFKKSGFLFQINIGSLIGLYGLDVMRTANYLLTSGVIDVVATDIHSIEHARIILKKGLKRLEAVASAHQISDDLSNISYKIPNKTGG